MHQVSPGREYIDDNGCRVRVDSGLGGDTYMSMRIREDGGGMHRVKSPKLPPRPSRAEAQADLDAYAADKEWAEAAATVETLPAVPREDDLRCAVEQIFHGEPPCDLGQVEANIELLQQTERLSHEGIAIEIAHGHALLAGEKAWVEWGAERYGYSKPYMHECRRVGSLLLDWRDDAEVWRAILPLPNRKLDVLAKLYAHKPEQFAQFVRMVDLEHCSRDRLRAKVNAFLDDDGDGGGDPGPEPPKEPKRRGTNWDGYLEKFAGLDSEENDDLKRDIAELIAPGIGMRAAMAILDMVLYSVAVAGEWSEENFDYWRPRLEQVMHTFDDLSGHGAADGDGEEAAAE